MSLMRLDIEGSDGRGGVLRVVTKEGASIALCKILWGKDVVSTAAAMLKVGCTADVQ